ncbi:uncharacterized protein FOMMEDRAFT_162025 [Fomitiporia mediterranea MF3/22]|uniref:uncharacterized protein n=1 Tax=Fomitiporia mediterranea (strain MF3/22) TaxID=694068 RepID=UPI0004407B93|nr:uncharacterized protein FOMMEDRAFT_162025 [Fomitiporia mediterranea MF3/22]EJC98266.1 hypothetical protein FOMMEDRAFT_162025 [Fomitiporia mediterranea MF3/22]
MSSRLRDPFAWPALVDPHNDDSPSSWLVDASNSALQRNQRLSVTPWIEAVNFLLRLPVIPGSTIECLMVKQLVYDLSALSLYLDADDLLRPFSCHRINASSGLVSRVAGAWLTLLCSKKLLTDLVTDERCAIVPFSICVARSS